MPNRQNKVNRALIYLVLLWGLTITGCTTVYVTFPVTHPAEINLSQYETIAFGRITGDMAPDIKFYLNEKLIRSSHIRIMDRPQQSHPVDMTRSSMLISGKAESYYDEEVTFKKKTCARKGKKDKGEHKNIDKHKGRKNHEHSDNHGDGKYGCTHYKRSGIMSTFGHFDFTEAETGQLLLSKNYKCKKEDYKTAIDEGPAAINADYLYKKCLDENVQLLFKTISPWQEYVKIPFEKDYRLPNLESGIYLAREGNLLGAIDIFSRELQAAEANSKTPNESVVNVYWNLGLAYEYSWQFKEAERMFRRANEITGNSKFLKEIAHNQQLQSEREELLKQLP